MPKSREFRNPGGVFSMSVGRPCRRHRGAPGRDAIKQSCNVYSFVEAYFWHAHCIILACMCHPRPFSFDHMQIGNPLKKNSENGKPITTTFTQPKTAAAAAIASELERNWPPRCRNVWHKTVQSEMTQHPPYERNFYFAYYCKAKLLLISNNTWENSGGLAKIRTGRFRVTSAARTKIRRREKKGN